MMDIQFKNCIQNCAWRRLSLRRTNSPAQLRIAQQMKIYVHYEGSVGPAFTVAQQVDDKLTTVKDAVAVFVGQYNAAQQTHVLDAHTQLYNADGQLLQQMAALSSLVEDREDVFVKGAVTAKTSSAKSAAPIPKTTPAPAPAPTPAPASTPKMAAPTVTVTAGVLEDLITQRNLRKARVLCEEALRVTNPRLPAHEIHWFLARISLLSDAQRNHAAAERYASQALSAGKRCTGVDTARYSLTLARAMYEAGDKYDEAEEVLSDLLHTYGSRRSVHILDARVLKAECLFELGKHEEAAGLLNDHMQWPGAEEHIPTLIAYARFAMRYKKVEEPVRALLKAIVADQKNKKCRAMLAELLSTEAGYAEFQRQVPSATGSAAAYAFLATAVKDCSAMPASIKLLSAALRVENEKSSSNKAASYALNLSHAHEIVYDFKNAFLVLVDFCKEHRTLRVGRRGYSCAELLQALTGGAAVGATAAAQLPLSAPPESERETYADHDIDLLAIGFAAVKVAYLRGQFSLLPGLYRVCEPTRLASKTPLHETAIRNEAAYYQCVFQTLDARKVSPDVRLTPFAGVPTAGELVTKPLSLPVCEPLWSHQLPATADPVLYLNNPAASSAQAGVPFEERVVTPALLAAAAASPVYICGDSHCLSPAWSVVYAPVGGVPPADTQAVKAAAAKAPPPTAEAGTAESGGGAGALVPRLLVPRLVTGVKQWHLRPDSSFYPKANFHHAVKNIPDGADVIFLIGEIDCREGLLLAVERDVYPTVTSGMDRVIDIFADVVRKLIRDKRFRVLIHPVVPVLDPTRAIVAEFNQRYRRKMEAIKGVCWLDLFDDLLCAGPGPSGTGNLATATAAAMASVGQLPTDQHSTRLLKPGLDLDGAHLHPKYAALIERELQRVM